MNFFSLCISTTFFSGFLLEIALNKPGKYGGLMGSFIGLFIQLWLYGEGMSLVTSSVLILVTFLLGILFVDRSERFMFAKWGPRIRHTGETVKHDFNQTNIDEVHGQLIAGFPLFFFLPLEVHYQIGMFFLSFILFRLFDVKKPWPIKRFEKLPGAWGVMLDDTVAGVMSALIILIIRLCL